ncbi:hypothetical protein QTP70_003960 [Hemibagrus guttatus]|uniref:Ty3 transposon capsid-like protein domain-containing protein n=1 Tax=Hemibagrus guttatus TaxID=175788 RepID=A0AAE0RBE6_9TELE|nr:hypothetical protein QTP70_003960 [Hemibagrus guttatus]
MDPSSNPPDPLQDLVAALRQVLAALLTPAPTPPTTTSADTVTASLAPLCSSPKAQPAPYSGSAEDCNGFLLQCSLVLEMQPHLYPTERSKVAFVITQLRGQALLWAKSLWSQDSPVTQSYAVFVEHFKEVFRKPSWDSSVGEELCKLQQGKLTVTEYALQFRTLAAKSGWNEKALLAAYRQGLSPQVRLHLAAHEDAIGLERLIQLSIRVATRMQSCVHRSQDQSPPYTRRDRPEPVSPPEPAPEPPEESPETPEPILPENLIVSPITWSQESLPPATASTNTPPGCSPGSQYITSSTTHFPHPHRPHLSWHWSPRDQ